jgi:hypothetical protein
MIAGGVRDDDTPPASPAKATDGVDLTQDKSCKVYAVWHDDRSCCDAVSPLDAGPWSRSYGLTSDAWWLGISDRVVIRLTGGVP